MQNRVFRKLGRLLFSIIITIVMIVASFALQSFNVASAIESRPSARNTTKLPTVDGPFVVEDADDTEITTFTDMQLIAYSDATKDDYANADIKANMQNTWAEISNAELSSLNSGLTDEVAQKIGGNSTFTTDNFIATYVFDLYVNDTALSSITAASGNHVDITFQLLEIEPNTNPENTAAPLLVLYKCEGSDTWNLVGLNEGEIVNNNNYTVTVEFANITDNISFIMFLTAEEISEPVTPTPDDGKDMLSGWIIVAIVAGAIALIFVAKLTIKIVTTKMAK